MPKFKNSNETFLEIFKHCASMSVWLMLDLSCEPFKSTKEMVLFLYSSMIFFNFNKWTLICCTFSTILVSLTYTFLVNSKFSNIRKSFGLLSICLLVCALLNPSKIKYNKLASSILDFNWLSKKSGEYVTHILMNSLFVLLEQSFTCCAMRCTCNSHTKRTSWCYQQETK